MEPVETKELEEKLQLPEPKGYKLLIAMPEKEDKTKGGIFIPDELKDREHVASIYGYVVSMGPLSYNDKERFPDGPWCQVGDFVIFRSYSGTRFKIGEQEFRLINDDTVEAVVADPRAIERAI